MSDFTRFRPERSSAAQKAVFVADSLDAGGKERVVSLLARGMAREGCDVVVITLRQAGRLGDELMNDGVKVVEMDSRRSFDIRTILGIRHFIRKFRPHVINVHDRASLVYVSAASVGLGACVVMTCHGLLAGSHPARFDERWASRRLAGITAVSREVAGGYIKRLQLRPMVKIIENGVEPVVVDKDAGALIREELGLGSEDMLLLSVGNIKQEKGYEDLIAAAEILSHRKLLKKLKFIIVGGIADEIYNRRLRDMITEAGLEGMVRFVGAKSDVASYYSAADAFVMSSRSEGLPMVLLEAMSAGLPVLATSVGGIPQVIGDNCGLLCPPQSPEMLAASIELVCTDPDFAHRMAADGRRKAIEHYSSSVMTRAYMEYFRKLVKPCEYGVVMVSPALPLEGGMANVAGMLMEGLESRMIVRGINSGKLTSLNRSIFAGIASQRNLRRQMLKKINRMENCICHIHTCSGMSFWRDAWLAKSARRAGAKVLLHIHGGRFGEFLSGLGGFMRWRAGRILRKTNGVISLGETLMEQYKVPGLPKNISWMVVHNGVKIPDRTASGGSGKFLFLGNYSRNKAAADLIKAIAVAREKGVELSVTIAGVETAPGQLDELRAMVDEMGLRQQVELSGLLTGAVKYNAIMNAVALVLPSHMEAQPVAVLEAMAAGLAVIATCVGDVTSVVRDGVDGILVPPKNPDMLADAMIKLYADAVLRQSMGRNGRERATERYSLAVVTDELIKIYDELLGGRQ